MADLPLPETPTQLHRLFEAMSNRLRTVFPASMFDLQMMPPAPSREEWQRVTQRSPCIVISWIGIEPKPGATRLVKGDAVWAIYLVVDNTTISRRYLGDARGVGLYGMVTAASYQLHGHTIDGVATLQVTEVGEIAKAEWADATMAIAQITVKAPIVVGDGIAGASLDDFLRLGCSWLANGADAGAGLITLES
jgi:hypothetical protein